MKTYKRTSTAIYTRVTEVNEAGEWRTWAEWGDGSVTDYHEDTLQNMGWHSVAEFLRARPGFVPVVEGTPAEIVIDDAQAGGYVPAQEVQQRDIPDDWEIGE